MSVLSAAWCRETSYCPDEWSEENPARGQCAVTALVVQDLLGGIIVRSVVGDEVHYWNELLPDGTHVDLTREQFPSYPVDLVRRDMDAAPRDRAELLANADTKKRYLILRDRLTRQLLLLGIA